MATGQKLIPNTGLSKPAILFPKPNNGVYGIGGPAVWPAIKGRGNACDWFSKTFKAAQEKPQYQSGASGKNARLWVYGDCKLWIRKERTVFRRFIPDCGFLRCQHRQFSRVYKKVIVLREWMVDSNLQWPKDADFLASFSDCKWKIFLVSSNSNIESKYQNEKGLNSFSTSYKPLYNFEQQHICIFSFLQGISFFEVLFPLYLF